MVLAAVTGGKSMRPFLRTLMPVIVCILISLPMNAQEDHKDKVKYLPKSKDPVTEEMEKKNRQREKDREAETRRIRDEQAKAKEKEKELEIRLDFSNIEKPSSPGVFKQAFHFEPIRQYLTSNCWAFSTTSFFESEVYRLSSRKIKISEMYTVYFELLEKARRYVRERGESYFQEGSEGNAVIMIWRLYGIVPAEAYKGVLVPDGLHDHSEMAAEMTKYLEYVKNNNLWDEELVLSSLRLIMDRYMGRPPEQFEYAGEKMTPRQFLADVLKLNLDDYVSLMSTSSKPYYKYGEYAVEGNWWHSPEYFNLPLDEFYQTIRSAIQAGYTVRLNGDVTEPGYYYAEGVAIVPTFDIPTSYINQDSREFRFKNKTTDDDHDIHAVGFVRVGNFDWYLIKDSGPTGHRSPFKGYLMFREDYVKLKMLTYIVHKSAVRALTKNSLGSN
jgi:bleomycin hydrolase